MLCLGGEWMGGYAAMRLVGCYCVYILFLVWHLNGEYGVSGILRKRDKIKIAYVDRLYWHIGKEWTHYRI